MKSFGENEVVVNATIVGRVRVCAIEADHAIFPRLRITVGFTLFDQEKEADGHPPRPFTGTCELRGATGELRLSESTDAIGNVFWAGPRRFVRSTNFGSESLLRFVCDLDHQRLELIERRRTGGALTLWLQVWPTLVAAGQFLDADLRPIRAEIPRDDWLALYATVGGGEFDVIEVQYSSREAEQFRRAVARVQEARRHIAEGDTDGAVALCRNAIEALKHELESIDEDPIKGLLERRTDVRRAKEYLGIVSRLKQLSGFAHHEFGEPLRYSRAEAQFVVRTTESLLALLGRLSQPEA